jgi:hypothetical protein
MRQSEYIVHRTLSKFLKSKAQAQIALGNPRDDVRETWRSPRALRAQIDTSIRYHASQSALRCTPARGKYSSMGAPNQKKKNRPTFSSLLGAGQHNFASISQRRIPSLSKFNSTQTDSFGGNEKGREIGGRKNYCEEITTLSRCLGQQTDMVVVMVQDVSFTCSFSPRFKLSSSNCERW